MMKPAAEQISSARGDVLITNCDAKASYLLMHFAICRPLFSYMVHSHDSLAIQSRF